MFKKLLTVFICVLAVLCFASCNRSDGKHNAPTDSQAASSEASENISKESEDVKRLKMAAKELNNSKFEEVPQGMDLSGIISKEAAEKEFYDFLELMGLDANAKLYEGFEIGILKSRGYLFWRVDFDRGTCEMDAKTGAILAFQSTEDVETSPEKARGYAEIYAEYLNEKVEGMFDLSDECIIRQNKHKMTGSDATRLMHECSFLSKNGDLLIGGIIDSTRDDEGNIDNSKSTAHTFAIVLSEVINTVKASDYVYIPEKVSDMQQNDIDACGLSESEAEEIVRKDIEKLNEFLPKTINIKDFTLESLGYNRISGGKCLQTLWEFYLKSENENIRIFVSPELKKISHIIFENDIKKSMTEFELLKLSQEFIQYLGIEIPQRSLIINHKAMRLGGCFIYDDIEDCSHVHDGVYALIDENGALQLYFSNNFVYYPEE